MNNQITREYLQNILTESLRSKLIGTKYCGQEIGDVRAQIDSESVESSCGCYSTSFDTIEVSIRTRTAKGRLRHWETVRLNYL